MRKDNKKLDMILNNMIEFKISQDEMKKELIGLNEKTSTLSENQNKMNEELGGLNEKTSTLSENQNRMNEELGGLNEKTFLLTVGQHQIKEELHSLTNTTYTLREEFYLFRHDAIERFNEISSTLTRIEEDQTKDIEAILEEISVKLDERG
ncbi:hypothetical protein LC085_12030 [Bacillus tianshenii]|uniref:hypothetical protein n=1 Tax=Sutcliffiella tianshenii TaxID=1463404 RepID=UPI001CD2B023|nr:hypothetical protein [Bacillus tianshenii]MCA1320641.1 hypothetical protein [Bacillus tianshenii]